MKEIVGAELAFRIRSVSLALYRAAAEYAATRGIIIADTKFEFGLDKDGNLLLMDEVLTPDSSRFWPADEYSAGQSPPSFDKQFVRDWLETAAVGQDAAAAGAARRRDREDRGQVPRGAAPDHRQGTRLALQATEPRAAPPLATIAPFPAARAS